MDPDIALANMLDRQARNYEELADKARAERRAVWLRLHEQGGMRYEDLHEKFGYGTTTLHTELRRARQERDTLGGQPPTHSVES